MKPITLTSRQLHAACHAWEIGGHLALGLWAAKAELKDWCVRTYGELVRAVREELMDNTNYAEMVAEYDANEPARARRRKHV
jgi:hypothetical protein